MENSQGRLRVGRGSKESCRRRWIDQCATRSLFKTLMGHSEPFYSCYINDSKHKGKVGYIPIFSDLNYFIPNFQVKLVCNPHSAGTQLKFVIHWLLKYVNVFLSTC